jgi:hypothetical protein
MFVVGQELRVWKMSSYSWTRLCAANLRRAFRTPLSVLDMFVQYGNVVKPENMDTVSDLLAEAAALTRGWSCPQG